MSEKNVDKDAYVWAHVGTIIFHVILGLIIVTYALKLKGSKELNHIRLVLLIVGGLLVVVSLLGLWPILKDYDKIIIE